MLGRLAFNSAPNGYPTQTHALRPGSPALTSGSFAECGRVDQRGVRRPQGTDCDIGAFEAAQRVLGASVITPTQPAVVAGETLFLTLGWTVPPTMTWHDLHTVALELIADNAQGEAVRPLLLRFTESVTTTAARLSSADLSVTERITNGLTLFNSDGSVAGVGMAGSSGVLESDRVVIDLAQSSVQGSGLDEQSVMLTLALRFKPTAAGRVYATRLMTSDDGGVIQGPEGVGTFAAGPFSLFLPTITR
ncbi:MAG: hypothetical protein M3Q45_08865 [Chloroflexota bacterium]|nr:hypothetical protein [Chloroflexota bacterium]